MDVSARNTNNAEYTYFHTRGILMSKIPSASTRTVRFSENVEILQRSCAVRYDLLRSISLNLALLIIP